MKRGVLPLDMVENSINLSKPISGSFFRHDTVRKGHLLLEESSIRRLLLALSPISTTCSCTNNWLEGSQAQTSGNG